LEPDFERLARELSGSVPRCPEANEQQRADQGQDDDDDQGKKNESTRLYVAHAVIPRSK
jgi:hypothetical protein